MKVEILIQCDFSVQKPEQNIKCLRIIAGYVELKTKNKDVLLVVCGYGGGGVQESRTYKITYNNKKLNEIYSGYVFPDVWERKYIEGEEYESGESLSSKETRIFENILSEFEKWITAASSFEENDSENTDYYFKLDMKDALNQINESVNLLETSNFQITHLKYLQEIDWPFITTF